MSDANSIPPSVTAGLQSTTEFARDVGRTERTVARWVQRGMPVIKIGATPWIDPVQARLWFENGMPPPQPDSKAAPRARLRRRAG